uniref:Uncharacterized protein n=1 Tax=Kalanchoe fedtschenkoi TaxID=63787 RepID=A0A7N0TM23_KALFE
MIAQSIHPSLPDQLSSNPIRVSISSPSSIMRLNLFAFGMNLHISIKASELLGRGFAVSAFDQLGKSIYYLFLLNYYVSGRFLI